MSRTVQETLLELRETLRRMWVHPGTRRAAAREKAVESTERAYEEDRELEGDQLPGRSPDGNGPTRADDGGP